MQAALRPNQMCEKLRIFPGSASFEAFADLGQRLNAEGVRYLTSARIVGP
jgi:hypothetical protein